MHTPNPLRPTTRQRARALVARSAAEAVRTIHPDMPHAQQRTLVLQLLSKMAF
jgi:hypothetical protein